MSERLSEDGVYEWRIDVRRWNHYGDKVVSRTPMTVLAQNNAEVTAKVRAAFGATYDDFRKFWSHDWTLRKVVEVASDAAALRAERDAALAKVAAVRELIPGFEADYGIQSSPVSRLLATLGSETESEEALGEAG